MKDFDNDLMVNPSNSMDLKLVHSVTLRCDYGKE